MPTRDTLTQYLNKLLEVAEFRDFCPNGLQVEGKQQINKVIVGVTACKALLVEAAQQEADGIIVHHGLFWKGDDFSITGIKKDRLQTLFHADMNLWAYHLPLDCHLQLGNNAQLGKRLNLRDITSHDIDGVKNLFWSARLEQPMSAIDLKQHLGQNLGQTPIYLGNNLKQLVTTIGWCSGAAQKYITEAKAMQLDAFFSGEASEQSFHLAREYDLHYFACGHHATERYGVQALAENLTEQFSIETIFVDVPNPI